MLKGENPKVDIIEKRWAGFLPTKFEFRWTNVCNKQRNKKEARFIWPMGNKIVVL
jgi:hypothetical protein